MALTFLQATPKQTLGRIADDLSFIDSDIDLNEFIEQPLNRVSKKLDEINESLATRRRDSKYGSWLYDETHIRDSLLAEALKTIIEEKRGVIATERLIPGAVYYSGVARFGDRITGQRCIYLGESFTGWMKFKESAATAKALTVLRHGTKDDFRNLYVGIADGRPDALNTITLEHITESSTAARAKIEEYCDARWDGPWPWEVDAPEKLKMILEHREEKKMKHIEEMQLEMQRIIREFQEGALNQYEMIAAAQEMTSKVDSIIADLGKLSSTGIEVMAQAKATGDEQLVEPMQQALGDPLNNSVSALTDLKAALVNAMGDLTGDESGAPRNPMNDPGMGDDMGSPADAMGNNPMGDDDADAVADIDIGGDEGERPMKEL